MLIEEIGKPIEIGTDTPNKARKAVEDASQEKPIGPYMTITTHGIYFFNGTETEPIASFEDRGTKRKKKKRTRCAYCGCFTEKTCGTCDHCGAPIAAED